MGAMNNMTLPLPNPHDWISVRGAANLLRMSTRTIRRMVGAGVLTAYRPIGGIDEEPPLMLWRAEVETVLYAQLKLKAGAVGRDA
jgi:excisionase family DNA binding protein